MHVAEPAAARGGGGRGGAGRGDAPGRDRPAEPVRVADGHNELADAQPLGGAERGCLEGLALGAEEGEVGEGVAADDLEALLAAVREGGPTAAGAAADDVRRGQEEPV